jgi:two-component system phosphate regulon sensor histidine kinase PhoR
MNFIKKSFGRKLAFAYGVLFVSIFALAYFYAAHVLETRALAQLKNTLTLEARLIHRILVPVLTRSENRAQLIKLTNELGQETKARVTVIDLDGVVLADSLVESGKLPEVENHKERPEVRAALGGEIGTNVHFSKTLKVKMMYLAIPLVNNGGISGVLRLALPLDTVYEILHSLDHPLVISSIIGILAVLFFSVVMSKTISSRVGKLTETAKHYAEGDLSRKIYLHSGDELETLGKTMNQMALALRDKINEIERERAKFYAVFAHMAEGVIAVSSQNKILLVNPSAERIFKIRQQEAYERSFIEVIRNKKIDEMMTQAISESSLISTEVELPQWGDKFLRVNALGISKSYDGVAGILVISDVSEIRRLENVRREFVANVSHELRTPLTSIGGFIETLLGGTVSDPARSKEFLKMMEEDAGRLTKLIDDLLELSKIEAKRADFKPAELLLAEQVNKAAVFFHSIFEERKLSFENKVPENVIVTVDPNGLKQVLVNLIDNAVKFNKENGRITVTSEIIDRAVKVSIKDTGAGIPEEAIGRVFERFYRVDKARSRELGGTGLGLAIVKHIIEAHDGKVWCESELGKGSTFLFTLPVVSR